MIYLNGQFLPLEEARVSVLDRAFLFGDGAYEFIPVYSRFPFRLKEHLRRLQATLDGLRIRNPLSDAAWTGIIETLIARNEPDDQAVYLQVTRGADTKRHHAFPEGVAPTVFIMTEPRSLPPPEQRENGVAAITAADFRWLRCDLKTTSLLANCLLRQQAVENGCAETILFRDGLLTEGSASNVFMVRDGVMYAPPRSHLMLAGITCDLVLELAQQRGLAHHLRAIREEEVRSADELWLTSSTKEVLAVTTLDGLPVGSGRPGPVFKRMLGWFQEYKQTVMNRGEP
ncbi:MAG: D-amino acid aminotransferase [Rhodocyclaceae bacterium]